MKKSQIVLVVIASLITLVTPFIMIVMVFLFLAAQEDRNEQKGITEAKQDFPLIQERLSEHYKEYGEYPETLPEIKPRLNTAQITPSIKSQYYLLDTLGPCSYELSLKRESFAGEGGGDSLEYYKVSGSDCQ